MKKETKGIVPGNKGKEATAKGANFVRGFAVMAVMAICASLMCTVAFASTGGANVAITTEMLEPVVDSIVSNIAIILPIGITIFGIMLGISLVPRIIHRFTN